MNIWTNTLQKTRQSVTRQYQWVDALVRRFSSTFACQNQGGPESRMFNPNTKAETRHLFGRVLSSVLGLGIQGPNLVPFSWLGLGLGLGLG